MTRIGYMIGLIFLLFCLFMTGGYFLPSLFYSAQSLKQSEQAFKIAYQKTLPPIQGGTITDYEAYLSQKINHMLVVFTGNTDASTVVRVDLSRQTKKQITKTPLPNTAVIQSETLVQKPHQETVKTLTYAYQEIQTQTEISTYIIHNMTALIFLRNTQLSPDKVTRQKQLSQIKTLTQALIGADPKQGNLIRLVIVPDSIGNNTFWGISFLTIKQMIAFVFISLTVITFFLFFIPGLIKKIAPCPSLSALSRQICHLSGMPAELITDTQLLETVHRVCADTPDLAVQILRKWLMTHNLITNKDVFSPAQQGAILLLTLNDGTLKKIFRRMSADETATLTHLMTCLGQLKATDVQAVLSGFMRALNEPSDQKDINKQALLKNASPIEKAGLILQESNTQNSGRTVWDKLEHVSTEQVASFLATEYPQTTAVILYHLSDEKAGAVLTALPMEISTPALMRLTALKYVSFEKIRAIETGIEKQFFPAADKPIYNGYEKASAILSLLDQTAKKRLLDALSAQAPQTARKLSQQIICFDDIAFWPDKDIRLLIKQTPQETLILALTGALGKTKEAFSRNIAPQIWGQLLKRLSTPQTGKIKEIDDAQCFMIKTAQKLIDSRKIKRKA